MSTEAIGYDWVKLSAPKFKVERNDFKEFDITFSCENYYDVQISNNKQFEHSDSDNTKNIWTKTYQAYRQSFHFRAPSNSVFYVRARKYYYNKKGKLVVGPWSKIKKVIPY